MTQIQNHPDAGYKVFSAIVLIFFTCTNSLALFTEINNQFLDYMIVSTVNPNYVIEQEKITTH